MTPPGPAFAAADPPAPPRVNVLGVGVSAVNMELALQLIARWIEQRQHHYVCVRDMHGVVRSQRNRELKRIHNRAGLVTPDGMPLVWLCRWAGHKHVSRVYGPDLMLAVCQESVRRGWRHYFYGGHPGVAQLLAQRLQQRFAGLQVVGLEAPPFGEFTAAEDAQALRRINDARPDIVWIGLSTPKQEHWMAAHREQVEAPVLIGVGAAFDFHAGLKPQAPRWMQRSGLEWLFRLGSEPRRLWKRYLLGIPVFLTLLTCQKLHLKRYPLET